MQLPIEQELLLKTIFHPRAESEAAWLRWTERFDLESVDFDTYRLLPMVYKTLVGRGIEDPRFRRLKQSYKNNFIANQLLFYNSAKLFKKFQLQGIELILLKGSAAVLQYYDDIGARYMADIDVMLPKNRAREALEMCLAAGWSVVEPGWGIEEGLEKHHSVALSSGQNAEIDFHWHLLHEYPHSDLDELYRQHTVAIEFEGLSLLAPDPSNLFFHLCVNGMRGPKIGSYWIVDVLRVGASLNWKFDWERILSLSHRGCCFSYFRDCLPYLAKEFDASIPAEVMSEFQLRQPRFIERLRIHSDKQLITGVSGGGIFRIYDYARENPERTSMEHVRGFLAHLKDYWEVKYWWQFPIRGLQKISSVLRRWISSSKP